MATGKGGHSAADLPRYLEEIDYPASRQQIIDNARQHHADPQMIERLERFPTSATIPSTRLLNATEGGSRKEGGSAKVVPQVGA